MTTITKRQSRNMLPAKVVFNLNCWVNDNKHNFSGMTKERIAADASKYLGVPITPGNITGALQVCDVTLTRVSHTSDRTQILAQELAGLFTSLGQEVPARVHAIATRRKPV